ncbi:conserved Plasmodium protein, unknown function [Plasmodium relictum]|uniref:Uncharacterized protein n=1 Tax=Plasmodium relictum TaxID=85471 RepID=A0A1J1H821_PLARL|nr:conserved Plasmodium protein, unknown function [Plasmodium relictum]CRH00934.1 conserved Plasmodium protein, unknown function [Plasmodium relictum]
MCFITIHLKKKKKGTMKLYILYLLLFLVNCSENLMYEKIKKIVNEVDKCSLEDVEFMDDYTLKLYWIWINNFFKYLRVKTYIYENDDIYKHIIKKHKNMLEEFKDNFIYYNDRSEFIKNALNILSNEKTLRKMIDLHVPIKQIKFFQDLTEITLLNIFLEEKSNLINSYKKYIMFEELRDVANSKYYYHKKLLENKWESKNDDTLFIDKKKKYNNDNDNINNKQLKNVITLNINEIPYVKEMQFDYYDNKKWDKYLYYEFNDPTTDSPN